MVVTIQQICAFLIFYICLYMLVSKICTTVEACVMIKAYGAFLNSAEQKERMNELKEILKNVQKE